MEFKVIKETLPAITFNFDELKKALAETMEKYSGAIVTEDNLQGCKATQKELAGIRLKIDTYRKDKKKELSKPIAEFESQCKELIELVEKAENPIKEGIKIFDDKKREEKKKTAEILINHAVSKYGLNQKYALQLTISDKYTNLTAKEKDVAEDIESRALFLKEQQNKELEMLEIINDTIENANKNINAKMYIADFQLLINQNISTKEIISQINSRAERIKKSEDEAEQLRLKREQEEKERLTAPPQEVKPEEPKQQVICSDTTSIKPHKHLIEVRIIGLAAETKAVSEFMKTNNIKFELLKHQVIEG